MNNKTRAFTDEKPFYNNKNILKLKTGKNNIFN